MNATLHVVLGIDGDSNRLVLKGVPGDGFVEAFERAITDRGGGRVETGVDGVSLSWQFEDDPNVYVANSGSDLTLGEAAGFLGGLTAQGRPLVDVNFGVGGEPVGAFLTIAQVARAVASGVRLADAGSRAIDKLRYRTNRRWYEDWRDERYAAPAFRKLVYSENPWRHEDVERVFGITDAEAASLMLAVRYRPARNDAGNRIWIHDEADGVIHSGPQI